MPLRNVRPKKALGQHFLTDPLIARRIAETIPESYRSLPVLEIGPGMGILTRELMDICPDLYLLEIDGESIDYLSAAFPSLFAEQRVVKGDVLRCTDEAFIPGKPDTAFVMTGNYPYNISGRLFFRIFELHDRIPCCTGMLQKEVAERLTAGPGSRTYGILSVLLHTWYDAEYLFTVDKSDFNPPPKVHGGVLRLTRNSRTALPCDEKLFVLTVKTAFNQRRKTLRNAMRRLFPEDFDFSRVDLFTKRAEQLDVPDFIQLTHLVEEQGSENPLIST